MSEEPKLVRTRKPRAKRGEVLTRPRNVRAELASHAPPEYFGELVLDPRTKLIRVDPPRYCARIMVIDKTTGPKLVVHAQAGADGTIVVQVIDAPAAASAPETPLYWCQECATDGRPHRFWCGVK